MIEVSNYHIRSEQGIPDGKKIWLAKAGCPQSGAYRPLGEIVTRSEKLSWSNPLILLYIVS